MPMTMEKAQVTLPSDREVKVTRSFKAARPPPTCATAVHVKNIYAKLGVSDRTKA